MKKFTLLAILCLQLSAAFAQSLYIKTFGDPHRPAIIFIHGGPRGNSVLFEATTAQKLADKGFYVLLYDRRGEGRSGYQGATLTYAEAFKDLDSIYQQYHLTRAHLIGFSFGGLVATLFAAHHPAKVDALILTSGLFAQQATYDHILDSVTRIYTQKQDTQQLRKVQQVTRLDKHSAAYRGECFALASANRFFKAPQLLPAAQALYKAYEADPLSKQDIRNDAAPLLFYKNEKRNNIDVRPVLLKLKQQHVRIYALYGKQDGIFSAAMLNSLQAITGAAHFALLDNSSHYIFVDRQETFLETLSSWLR